MFQSVVSSFLAPELNRTTLTTDCTDDMYLFRAFKRHDEAITAFAICLLLLYIMLESWLMAAALSSFQRVGVCVCRS